LRIAGLDAADDDSVMPISPSLRHHYGSEWRAISAQIRFDHARGRCETCDRPHLKVVQTLPDGQWYDNERHVWRDGVGQRVDGPAGRDAQRLDGFVSSSSQRSWTMIPPTGIRAISPRSVSAAISGMTCNFTWRGDG
jgi:hypothetical protein